MTQEAFKAWWYNEGSQAPYTHHDCEQHTMRMCEIAWANGAYKALAEHAMREVQRLGQEIEQEPVAKYSDIVSDGGLDPRNKFDTTPPQRTWVGLTDEEIDYFIVHRLTIATKNNLAALIRICEAKLKEKNT